MAKDREKSSCKVQRNSSITHYAKRNNMTNLALMIVNKDKSNSLTLYTKSPYSGKRSHSSEVK